MISSEVKAKIAKDLGVSKYDTGSTPVQIGILTKRIEDLTKHVKVHGHDFHSRQGLLKLVGQRKRLLKYLKRSDQAAYSELVKKLNIRESN